MAKAQAVKPKSFFGDLFGRFGSPKAKPAARPSSGASSTMTNLPAQGAAARKPSSRAAAPERVGWSLADLRLPVIGSKPVTTQLQVLGITAGLLLAFNAILVFEDTTQRTRNA